MLARKLTKRTWRYSTGCKRRLIASLSLLVGLTAGHHCLLSLLILRLKSLTVSMLLLLCQETNILDSQSISVVTQLQQLCVLLNSSAPHAHVQSSSQSQWMRPRKLSPIRESEKQRNFDRGCCRQSTKSQKQGIFNKYSLKGWILWIGKLRLFVYFCQFVLRICSFDKSTCRNTSCRSLLMSNLSSKTWWMISYHIASRHIPKLYASKLLSLIGDLIALVVCLNFLREDVLGASSSFNLKVSKKKLP